MLIIGELVIFIKCQKFLVRFMFYLKRNDNSSFFSFSAQLSSHLHSNRQMSAPAPRHLFRSLGVDVMREVFKWAESSSVIQLWLTGDPSVRLFLSHRDIVTRISLIDRSPLSNSRWPALLSQIKGLTELYISRGSNPLPDHLYIRKELLKMPKLRVLHIYSIDAARVIFGEPKNPSLPLLAQICPELTSLSVSLVKTADQICGLPSSLVELKLPCAKLWRRGSSYFPPSHLTSLDLDHGNMLLDGPLCVTEGQSIGQLETLSLVLDGAAQLKYIPKSTTSLSIELQTSELLSPGSTDCWLPISLVTLNLTLRGTFYLPSLFLRYLCHLKSFKLECLDPVFTTNQGTPVEPSFPLSLTDLHIASPLHGSGDIVLPPLLTSLVIVTNRIPKSLWTEVENSEVSKKFGRLRFPHIGSQNGVIGDEYSSFALPGPPPNLTRLHIIPFNQQKFVGSPFEWPPSWDFTRFNSIDLLCADSTNILPKVLSSLNRLQSLSICLQTLAPKFLFPAKLSHLALRTQTMPPEVLRSLPPTLTFLHISEVKSTENPLAEVNLPHLTGLKWDIQDKTSLPLLAGNGWEHLKTFKYLEELELDMRLEASDEFVFSILSPTLRKLHIHGSIEPTDSNYLSHLPKYLSSLLLNIEKMSDDQVAHLPRFLRHLALPNTKTLTKACFTNLPRTLNRLDMIVEDQRYSTYDLKQYLDSS